MNVRHRDLRCSQARHNAIVAHESGAEWASGHVLALPFSDRYAGGSLLGGLHALKLDSLKDYLINVLELRKKRSLRNSTAKAKMITLAFHMWLLVWAGGHALHGF